jgi:integrase
MGNAPLKARVQHPKLHEEKRHGAWWWFFRYWKDEILADGSVKSTRERHWIGPSRGKEAIPRKEAEVERDKHLAKINAPTEQAAATKGLLPFRAAAKMYIASHLERRNKVSKPTRLTEAGFIENHLIPKWGDKRLVEIEPKEVEDWLYETFDCWNTMRKVKQVMRSIYSKAEQWGYWDENRKCPISKVDIGKKEYKWERRILDEGETVRVLARIPQPHLLICETCLITGTRISEVLGLQIKHVDLEAGTIRIEQRHWKGDIAAPKTENSKRTLALGDLVEDFRAHIAKLGTTDSEAWVFPQDCNATRPMWDSGVRKILKQAAAGEGLDFPGFGLHSLRRANISWRQKCGASSIEASKLAGHSSVAITEQYTFVDLERQRELTQSVRARLAKAREAKKQKDAQKVVPIKGTGAAA